MIWTTTIWTLPGNLAIALHPDESYALVQAPNGEIYVMAQALTEKVMKVGALIPTRSWRPTPALSSRTCWRTIPSCPRPAVCCWRTTSPWTPAPAATTPPRGFGADDYQTCLRYGMDMVVPVDDQGRHTDYAGKYAGMKTDESNPIILADMKASGVLFASEEIVHSYPPLLAVQAAHHLPCHSPVVLLRGVLQG